MEAGIPLAATFRGFSALFFESTCLSLVKNPVSSITRLGNLLAETGAGLVRLPLSKPSGPVPPLAHQEGTSLEMWEKWLDDHTNSRRECGSIKHLIDGERFFPRFQQTISNATTMFGSAFLFLITMMWPACDLGRSEDWIFLLISCWKDFNAAAAIEIANNKAPKLSVGVDAHMVCCRVVKLSDLNQS